MVLARSMDSRTKFHMFHIGLRDVMKLEYTRVSVRMLAVTTFVFQLLLRSTLCVNSFWMTGSVK